MTDTFEFRGVPSCSIRPLFIDHFVGDLKSLFLVVGHENAGDVDFVMKATEPTAQLDAALASEGAKGSSKSKIRG
ncbi:MAG: hypothetical protein U1D30_21620 [Planctomycetota bacterium]